jgi:type IV pilus assembly protein PilM
MFRLGRQVQPISLDVGRDSVKMLQLSPGGQAVAAAVSRALPSDSADAVTLPALLSSMLVEAPFSGRRVIAALPHDIVHIRTVRLPQLPLDPYEALCADAADLFPFSLHEATVRLLSAGPVRHAGSDCREVIAFAARNQDVRDFLRALQTAGLKVDSLQVGAAAACQATAITDHQSRAILDLGASRSTLVIGLGSEINFVRSIEIGGAHLEHAISQKLSLDNAEIRQLRQRLATSQTTPVMRSNPVASAVFDATRGLLEELAHQVAMCFRYHAITFRGQRPASLQLIGGQSYDTNLQHALAAAVGLPTDVVQPLASLNATIMRPADRQTPAGQWGICMGLNRLRQQQNVTALTSSQQPLRLAA